MALCGLFGSNSSSSSPPISRAAHDQLLKEVAKLQAENTRLKDENARLRAENEALIQQAKETQSPPPPPPPPPPHKPQAPSEQNENEKAALGSQQLLVDFANGYKSRGTVVPMDLDSIALSGETSSQVLSSLEPGQSAESYSHLPARLNSQLQTGDQEPGLGQSSDPSQPNHHASQAVRARSGARRCPWDQVRVVSKESVQRCAERHGHAMMLCFWTNDPEAPQTVSLLGYKRGHVYCSPAFLRGMNMPDQATVFKAIDWSLENNPPIRQNHEGFLRNLLMDEPQPIMMRNIMYHESKACDIVGMWLVPVVYKKEDGKYEKYGWLSYHEPLASPRLYEGVMRDHVMLKYTPYMLALVDLRGAIITQNPLSCCTMGFHSAVTNFGDGWMTDTLPQVDYIQELFHLDDSLRANMLRVTSQGGSFSCTVEVTSPVLRRWMRLLPGSHVWHDVHVTRLKDPVLMEHCFVVAQLDVTDRILAEKQVGRLQQQVKKLMGDMKGEEADRLVIQDKIGQGGYGTVHRGVWRNLPVAVKMMLFQDTPEQQFRCSLPNISTVASSTSGDLLDSVSCSVANAPGAPGKRMQAVLKEAAVCCSLNHPNVVSTYHFDIQEVSYKPGNAMGGMEIEESGVKDYKMYLVQELCESSLYDVLRCGMLHLAPLEPQMHSLLPLISDVSKGMAYLHARSIVHGDLSTSNILLKISADSPDVMAKISDFGLCQRLDPQQTHVSNHNCGTPFYVAPEVSSDHVLTRQSDVYSFGVIMWEAYMGQAPWSVTPQGAFVRRQGFGAFPQDTLPRYVELAERCLRLDPSKRPTFDEIVAELDVMMIQLGPPPPQVAAAQSAALQQPQRNKAVQPQLKDHHHQQQQLQQAQEQGAGKQQQQQLGQLQPQRGTTQAQAQADDARAAAFTPAARYPVSPQGIPLSSMIKDMLCSDHVERQQLGIPLSEAVDTAAAGGQATGRKR